MPSKTEWRLCWSGLVLGGGWMVGLWLGLQMNWVALLLLLLLLRQRQRWHLLWLPK